MSRTYAKVKISIWGDSDFRELSDAAQALYFKLLTSPTLRLCGVVDWRPNRIAALTRGQTVAEVKEAARELQDDLYVIFDESTEEALLRTFIRHDGVLKTPNVAASMVKDFAAVASARLRGIIVHELRKMANEEPEHKGWVTVREVLDNPSINPSVKVSPNVSGNPSVKDDPNVSGNDAHNPQPPTPNPQPSERGASSDAPPAPKPKKGSRLPADWLPSDDVREAMLAELPDLDFRAEHAKFVDHWIAQPGAKGVKLNWDATWRNWMRRAAEFTPRHLRPVDDSPRPSGRQVIGEPPEEDLRREGIIP